MPPAKLPQPMHAHPPTPADSVHGQKHFHLLHHHHHPVPTLPKEPQSGVLQQPWVCIDAAGNSTVITEGRMKLIAELGIQGRDLRLLEEPPSGGTFLVREDAIIASLDFACIIITTKAAYIVNPSKPATVKFMTLLKQRLAFAAANLPNANGFKTWEEKEQQLLVQAHAESGRHSRPHLWRSSSKNSTKGQHTQPQEQLQLPIQQQASSPPKHTRFRHHHHHHKGPHPDWTRPRSADKDFPLALIPSKGKDGKEGKKASTPLPTLPATNGPPAAERVAAPQLSPFYIAATTPPTNWHAAPHKPHHQDFTRPSQQQQQQQHNQQHEQHYGKAHFVPQKPATLPIAQGTYTQQLPFELRVLELCLYELCSRLATASAQLEAMAMPLVDILLNQAELAVLEDLRFAKKQLADLTTKAARVCDLLKAFLDDDTDMWDMHLTAKETQRTAAQEAAARMMEEVTAMAEQAAHMPRLEKVEEEPDAELPPHPHPHHHHHHHHHHRHRSSSLPRPLPHALQHHTSLEPPPVFPGTDGVSAPTTTPVSAQKPASRAHSVPDQLQLHQQAQPLALPQAGAADALQDDDEGTVPPTSIGMPPTSIGLPPMMGNPPTPRFANISMPPLAPRILPSSTSSDLPPTGESSRASSTNPSMTDLAHHPPTPLPPQLPNSSSNTSRGSSSTTLEVSELLPPPPSAPLPPPPAPSSIKFRLHGSNKSTLSASDTTPTNTSSTSTTGRVPAPAPPVTPMPPPLSPYPPKSNPQWIASNNNDTKSSNRGSQGGSMRLNEQNLRMLGSSPKGISPSQSFLGINGSPGRRGSGMGKSRGNSLRGNSNPTGSSRSSSSSGEFDQAVSQVEMLIESYYLQLDDAYNRLKAMADYIEDAEDMVHLHLNATQNVLLAHDLIFSVVFAVSGVLFTVAQFFTMNVKQGPYQSWPWFFDMFAPLISLGSWVLGGGLIVFLMHVYLYRIETGKSWFSRLFSKLRIK